MNAGLLITASIRRQSAQLSRGSDTIQPHGTLEYYSLFFDAREVIKSNWLVGLQCTYIHRNGHKIMEMQLQLQWQYMFERVSVFLL